MGFKVLLTQEGLDQEYKTNRFYHLKTRNYKRLQHVKYRHMQERIQHTLYLDNLVLVIIGPKDITPRVQNLLI